jgi:mRNA interferase MazF
VKEAGQIVLFRFPRTDWGEDKLRPAMLLAALPGPFDDWLVCMISSQITQAVPEFDEIIGDTDPDFADSGLKVTSVIRIGRLAVVDGAILLGAIGEIGPERLERVRKRLAKWLSRP